jgi:hypothetical protein
MSIQFRMMLDMQQNIQTIYLYLYIKTSFLNKQETSRTGLFTLIKKI